MGNSTSKTETGLTCNTGYTRYAWAYSACGHSTALTLNQTTSLNPPNAPTSGNHVLSQTQIVWNWNSVPDAMGYKWNTTNDYGSATDMGTATSKTETGLTCNTAYTRYAWAYSNCGNSTVLIMNLTTSACTFSCGSSLLINHVAGAVAPVSKTVTYGTVTNIPGETSKCWITSNLGADHQATAVDDATEPSAGWYWQFNRKQGYKHDGTTRTPNTTWITAINEDLDWEAANDPCTLEFGSGWRLPTYVEWYNVDNIGNWTNWNGPWNSSLKLHAAGHIYYDNGSLGGRGSYGAYWSNTRPNTTYGWYLPFTSGYCYMDSDDKANGFSIRCLRDGIGNFYIGQSYGGGIIFYIDGTGQHGLISATTDQSAGAQWGCYNNTIGGTSTAIGTGQANTTLIVNNCSEAGRAARICNDLVLNGYSDWFLPSKDELNQMYLQKSAIGGFADNFYWSSSEYTANDAWDQFFSSGLQRNYASKNNPNYVRAVRAF
jgi:hypothetical protein